MKEDSFLRKLKRVSFDLISILIIGLILVISPFDVLPPEAKAGFFSIAFTKFFLVSCGIVHFHFTRKLMFPYINFKEETCWTSKMMVIVMFSVIVFCWARGG